MSEPLNLIDALRYKASSQRYICHAGMHEPDTQWCSACIMRAAADKIEELEGALRESAGKSGSEVTK